MLDKFSRKIDYLRISVTDKCNLRCVYCMPKEGITYMEHEELLTFEEILRICQLAGKLGIKKIKITGGEPLVRRGIIDLIRKIKAISDIHQVTLTTNGILLDKYMDDLVEIGLDGINISLDCTGEEDYKSITRVDAFEQVIKGIETSVHSGIPTKINCVPIKELNGNQIVKIAEIAKTYAVDIRFIELMPIGYGKVYHSIPNEEIMELLKEEYGALESTHIKRGNGPAIYYQANGFKGNIGFISAVSHGFCDDCNRIRLTCDGLLKLCLHYNKGLSLKDLMRNGMTDEKLMECIMEAVYSKPVSHNFNGQEESEWENKKMYQIGG